MDTSRASQRSTDARDPASGQSAALTDAAPTPRPAGLTDKTKKILADADQRDKDAAARDALSDKRARVADHEAFVKSEGTYTGHRERRAAALDRADSKSDRESSADDRIHLTEDSSS